MQDQTRESCIAFMLREPKVLRNLIACRTAVEVRGNTCEGRSLTTNISKASMPPLSSQLPCWRRTRSASCQRVSCEPKTSGGDAASGSPHSLRRENYVEGYKQTEVRVANASSRLVVILVICRPLSHVQLASGTEVRYKARH